MSGAANNGATSKTTGIVPACNTTGINVLYIKSLIRLARLNKPIGIYLLLWPTMWALWLAAGGLPDTHNLIVFAVGVVLMRSAGCVINDYADRHFDGHVKRTALRPLVCGDVNEKEALCFFCLLVLLAFGLVLTTNLLTIGLSFVGLFFAVLYPFAKRHTYLPQVVLGFAYGWSIPMAFAAEKGGLTAELWILFLANMLWTVAYDTQYAMVDRDDDVKTGVKSTAILFGELDRFIVGLLQLLTLLSLVVVGVQMKLAVYFYLSLLGALALFIYQQAIMSKKNRDDYFDAFLSNHWVGLIVFVGIFIG